MRRRWFGLVLMALIAATGQFAHAQQPQGQPQTGLETASLVIETAGGAHHRFEVELALTPAQQGTGLMFRESMPMNHGMLFIFPQERPLSFWMRNTLISLDMLFIAADGQIINIAQRTTPLSERGVPSTAPGLAVLELNGGVTALLGIRAGDVVRHEAFGNAEPSPATAVTTPPAQPPAP